jgi:hypothetical protein
MALGTTFRIFGGGACELEIGFVVEELGICGKAFSSEGRSGTTAGTRASLSKGSVCGSNAVFVPSFEGNRSRLEAGNLRSAGGRIGVRMSGLRGLAVDFLSGDTLSIGTFDPVNQGAFGVFEISIRAALAWNWLVLGRGGVRGCWERVGPDDLIAFIDPSGADE